MSHTQIRALSFDDAFGITTNHWPYSTPELAICERIFYDRDDFGHRALDALAKHRPQVLAWSGRGAARAARRLEAAVAAAEAQTAYGAAIQAMRMQNTNLSERLSHPSPGLEDLRRFPNKWLQVGLDYPFDLLLVQTYGDAEIINRALDSRSARYLPFSFDDRRFRPTDRTPDLDIGMFFKTERHEHRLRLIEQVREIAQRQGWRWEFSDQYWGEDYAEALTRARVLLHYSYFGDVPYRLYEAAGSGVFLLTDPLSFGIDRMFTPGEDYGEFQRDLSDLEDRLLWALGHPQERAAMAASAYHRAKQDHTWAVMVRRRLAPLLRSILEERSAGRPASV